MPPFVFLVDLVKDLARLVRLKTSPDTSGVAKEQGVEVLVQPLNEGNYETVLEPLLGEGDFLLNLSVDVASLALVRWCWKHGVLYLDACNEPWPGRYDNPDCRCRSAPTTPARGDAGLPHGQAAGPPPASRRAPTPAWSRLRQGRRCSNMAADLKRRR
jgi:hypothetical protein